MRKKTPKVPGDFLPPRGLLFLMGFWGERGGIWRSTPGQRVPNSIPGRKRLKEKRELYTPARTRRDPHNKSPPLLIFSLDLEGES